MQFNFVFKDQSGRIKYKGSDVSKLSDKIVESVSLTKAQTTELAKFVYEEWKRLITTTYPTVAESSTPWRSRDYQADMLAGISKSVSSAGVSFKIEGDKALVAELGWGVPNSSEWEDGIGMYARGALQDLRPWLLNPGSPHVHDVATPALELAKRNGESGTWFSKTGATKYRVLKYDAPELSKIIGLTSDSLTSQQELAEFERTDQLMTDAARRKARAEHVKTLTHTARSLIDTDASGNIVFKPLDYSSVPPSENTHTYGTHMHWVYHRATLASTHLLKGLKDNKNDRRLAMNLIMQKAKFSVFRTITDSPNQIQAGLFFTKGVEPAGTMEFLKTTVVPDAIANILAGKNPDGSDRNGN